MKALLSPAFCSKALTDPSSSWSIALCRWVYRSPSVHTATLDTPDRRFFTWIIWILIIPHQKQDHSSIKQQETEVDMTDIYMTQIRFKFMNQEWSTSSSDGVNQQNEYKLKCGSVTQQVILPLEWETGRHHEACPGVCLSGSEPDCAGASAPRSSSPWSKKKKMTQLVANFL